jgi:hypothetical protein
MSTDDDAYDWDEKLNMGTKWETDLGNRLETVLSRLHIERIAFEDNPEKQLSGVDAVLSKGEYELDVKVQSNELLTTGNLPIETWSVVEEAIPGWFYTGEADVIAWAYKNKAGTNLHPTGYLLFKTDAFIEWFNDNIERFREVEVKTRRDRDDKLWHTKNRLVPIEEFPDENLVEFTPTLEKNEATDQFELTEFDHD